MERGDLLAHRFHHFSVRITSNHRCINNEVFFLAGRAVTCILHTRRNDFIQIYIL